jgi:hypothetical protein
MRHLWALAALLLVACGGATPSIAPGPSFDPNTVPSPDQLCQLLTPEDWASVGLRKASEPQVDYGEAGSAFCIYEGSSGGTGGLELDAYCCRSEAGTRDSFVSMKEGMAEPRAVSLAGCEECVIDPDVNGTFGALAGRSGTFAFGIALPASRQSERQLTTLANIVLTRAAALF